MGRFHKTDGIVLRTFPMGERDRLIKVFTRSRGVLAGVARGARASPNRFGAALMSGARVELILVDGRGMPQVTSAHLQSLHTSADAQVQDLIYRMLGHVASLPENVPQPAVFAELVEALSALLETGAAGGWAVYLSFRLRFLAHLGQCSDFSRCVQCGARLDAEAWLPPSAEGLSCLTCAAGDGAPIHGVEGAWAGGSANGGVRLDAATRGLCQYLLGHHPRLAARLRTTAEQRRRCATVVEYLLARQLDLPAWLDRPCTTVVRSAVTPTGPDTGGVTPASSFAAAAAPAHDGCGAPLAHARACAAPVSRGATGPA